jgi:ribose 5-phosphate isomerase B
VLGADHGGFELKEGVKVFLRQRGYQVSDYGCYSKDSVDYPDIACLVAEAVSTGTDTVGVMIDTIGIASAMVANKVSGVRAACCWNIFTAKSSREHNNANLLTLGGGVMGLALAQEIVQAWLQTEFAGGRHEKRVDKIMDVERRYSKGR